MKRPVILLCLAVEFGLFSVPGAAAVEKSIQNEVIILDWRGARPAAIKRAQGEFVLVMINCLPSKSEVFTLIRRGATPSDPGLGVPPFSTSADQYRVGQTVDLAPGIYQIQFKNHPQLGVTITITP